MNYDLTSLLQALIGTYVSSSDGIASIDFPWIFAALTFLLFLWFLMRIVLKIFGGNK